MAVGCKKKKKKTSVSFPSFDELDLNFKGNQSGFFLLKSFLSIRNLHGVESESPRLMVESVVRWFEAKLWAVLRGLESLPLTC